MSPLRTTILLGSALALLFGSAPQPIATAAPPRSVAPVSPSPGRAKTHRPTAYKVQVRHPGWKVAGVARTRSQARAMEVRLRRNGWSPRVHRTALGYKVSAHMPRWHTRAVVANHNTAHGLVRLAHAQGFQARSVHIH